MKYSIYLLRHCEYDNPRNILAGRLPLELSSEGMRKAHELKTYFADKSISRIYSSAVERCKQTAEIIADGTIPVEYDTRILESLSAYQGLWFDNKPLDWTYFFGHRDRMGGESLEDIQNRMTSFWEEVITKRNENILICSHADPIQVLYSYIQKLPIFDSSTSVDDAPGWINYGEYIELVYEDGKLKDTIMPAKVR